MRASDSADQKLQESPLWKKVVKAHGKVAEAQKARDGTAWAKAWKELSKLIEGNESVESPLPPVAKSKMIEGLEGAFSSSKAERL